jgi:hypothetical protein
VPECRSAMSSAEGHGPVGRRCSARRRRASARGPKVFCAAQKGIGPWAEGVLRSAEGHRPVGRRCSAQCRRASARGPKVFCGAQRCRCPRTGALCRAQKGMGPWAEGVLRSADARDEAREHPNRGRKRRRRLAGWAPATPAGRRPRTGGRRGVRAWSLVTGRALAAPMKHRSFRHGHARAGRARAGRRPRTDGGDPAKTAAAGGLPLVRRERQRAEDESASEPKPRASASREPKPRVETGSAVSQAVRTEKSRTVTTSRVSRSTRKLRPLPTRPSKDKRYQTSSVHW